MNRNIETKRLTHKSVDRVHTTDMEIYIKPSTKTNIIGKSKVLIKDVAEIIPQTLETIKILDIRQTDKKKNFLVSVTDIVKVLKNQMPDASIVNLGAEDTVVQYAPQKSKDNPVLKWAKVAIVSVILLTGSSTAIMSFQTDSQIPKVFETYYCIIYGQYAENPLIINIPYALGLALGITVFYNHFFGKKMTDDPTPIEVEMSLYENQVTETMVDVLDTREEENAS